MLFAMVTGDFYQAFRYNPLLFIALPCMLILFIEKIIANTHERKAWVDKIPYWCWIIIIALVILYGVLRNLPWFSFLAPTQL